jgi:hypothetical protein
MQNMRNLRTGIANAICRVARRKVVVVSNSGLGNRLKRLASYHAYHDLKDATLLWNSRGWVTAPFQDLFSLEGIEGFRSYAVNARLAGYAYPPLGHGDSWRLQVDPAEVDDSFLIERNGRKFLAIDFRYEAIPARTREKYLSFFSKLRPSHAVQRRIDGVHLDPDTVCVHVRNPVKASDAKLHCADVDWFLAKLAEYPRSQKFFISTMGKENSEPFYSTFGDRIVELPDKNYDSMVDAVADMFLLGMGKEIILSSGSTFSEVAWWLGGCSQRVVVAPPTGVPKIKFAAPDQDLRTPPGLESPPANRPAT